MIWGKINQWNLVLFPLLRRRRYVGMEISVGRENEMESLSESESLMCLKFKLNDSVERI